MLAAVLRARGNAPQRPASACLWHRPFRPLYPYRFRAPQAPPQPARLVTYESSIRQQQRAAAGVGPRAAAARGGSTAGQHVARIRSSRSPQGQPARQPPQCAAAVQACALCLRDRRCRTHRSCRPWVRGQRCIARQAAQQARSRAASRAAAPFPPSRSSPGTFPTLGLSLELLNSCSNGGPRSEGAGGDRWGRPGCCWAAQRIRLRLYDASVRPQPEWAFWPAGRADRELTAPCALTAAPFSAELRRHQLPGGCCPPGGASQPPDRGGGQGGGGRGHGALRAALLLAPGLRGPRAPRRPAPPRPPRPHAMPPAPRSRSTSRSGCASSSRARRAAAWR